MYKKKFILIGNSGCGKTSLVKHFILDLPLGEKTTSTIGAAYHEVNKYINNNTSEGKMALWDTCGQERYKSLTPIYYKGATACICVFDINNRESFDSCEEWLKLLKKYANNNVSVLLIANKIDLPLGNRKVTDTEIRFLCAIERCDCVYTSCTTLEGKEDFDYKIKEIIEKKVEEGLEGSLTLEDFTVMEENGCWC